MFDILSIQALLDYEFWARASYNLSCVECVNDIHVAVVVVVIGEPGAFIVQSFPCDFPTISHRSALI